MDLLDLTLTNMVGYGIIVWFLLQALSLRFSAQEEAKKLVDAGLTLDDELSRYLVPPQTDPSRGPTDDPPLLTQHARERLSFLLQRRAADHPTAAVLARALRDQRNVHDDTAVSVWITKAQHECLGSQRLKLEKLRTTAPAAGISLTILGFLVSAYVYSRDQNQAQMMAGIALALLTTFGSGIVTVIVRRTLLGIVGVTRTWSRLHAWDWILSLRHGLDAAAATPANRERG